MSEAPATAEAAKPAAPIKSPAMREANFARNTWSATVDPGTTFEDIARSDFWMHQVDRLRPSDKIEVNFADGTLYAELLVLGTSRAGARVAFVNKVDLRSTAAIGNLAAELADYDVTWGGPANRFRVVKKGVKEPIKSGFQTEEDAKTWLVAQYLTGADKMGTKVAA